MQEKKKNQEQMEYTGNKSKMADLNPVILLIPLHRNGPNTPLTGMGENFGDGERSWIVRLELSIQYTSK